MYCHFLLADYITLAAAPANPPAAVSDELQVGEENALGGHGPGLLPATVAAALNPGACALYGACSPAQVLPPPRSVCGSKTGHDMGMVTCWGAIGGVTWAEEGEVCVAASLCPVHGRSGDVCGPACCAGAARVRAAAEERRRHTPRSAGGAAARLREQPQVFRQGVSAGGKPLPRRAACRRCMACNESLRQELCTNAEPQCWPEHL